MANHLNSDEKTPLCVDLDGTLIKTDLFFESLLLLIKRNPIYIFLAISWLIQGKAKLKAELAKRVHLAVESLPYNQDVIEFLKLTQRKIFLVTGSNEKFANNIANHLGLFDEVFASDDNVNLTKENKRAFLADRFGKDGFDYIGNDRDDWHVWPEAQNVLVVAKKGRFLRSTRSKFRLEKEFLLPNITLRDWVKAIRAHQWIKNLLIFIPLLLEHEFENLNNIYILMLGFACLSLLASFTYIINDLLDLQSDRSNKTKKLRAFASGLISIKQAVFLMLLLLIAIVVLAVQLPLSFQLVLAAYFISTLSYSLLFKSVAILDVCVLASLYTLRVIGGGVIIGADWSFWLLAFSMFFFLSLALAKRVSELENIKHDQGVFPMGRGYQVVDLPMLMSAGVSSGMLSILVVALYINSEKVEQMYQYPQILWLICPLLLYWICRLWMITARGFMHEDPILFAIRDRVSLIAAVLMALVVLTAVVLPKFF